MIGIIGQPPAASTRGGLTRGDGIGGASPGRGSGLIGLTDRVQALGGTITVRSPTGQGTTLLVDLPVDLRDRPSGS